MLAARVDKKKIFEYSAILGIIFLIIGYVLVTTFLIEPGSGKDSSTVDKSNKVQIKKVNELKLEIIEDPKFKNLQEGTYKEKPLEELEVGKTNPFKTGEVKKEK